MNFNNLNEFIDFLEKRDELKRIMIHGLLHLLGYDHKSNTIYAEFQVKKTNKDYLKDVSVIIWTTTPWTIPANKALAYNKDISYSVLELKKLSCNL